jgi:hypothetical protein
MIIGKDFGDKKKESQCNFCKGFSQTKNDDKNYFEKKNFMQSIRRHSMDSVFFCLAEGGGGYFCFFPCSQMCSHGVPQVPKLFPKTFPIAPQLYPIWFAQSPTLMYTN